MFSGTNDPVRHGPRDLAQRPGDRQVPARPQGSIVLMEPKTGAIRAMWSYPSYDPNLVADIDYDAAYAYLLRCRTTHATRCSPTPPAAIHAGFDVQGADDQGRLDDGVVGLDSFFPDEARVRAAADQRPDPELRRHDLRR